MKRSQVWILFNTCVAGDKILEVVIVERRRLLEFVCKGLTFGIRSEWENISNVAIPFCSINSFKYWLVKDIMGQVKGLLSIMRFSRCSYLFSFSNAFYQNESNSRDLVQMLRRLDSNQEMTSFDSFVLEQNYLFNVSIKYMVRFRLRVAIKVKLGQPFGVMMSHNVETDLVMEHVELIELQTCNQYHQNGDPLPCRLQCFCIRICSSNHI